MREQPERSLVVNLNQRTGWSGERVVVVGLNVVVGIIVVVGFIVVVGMEVVIDAVVVDGNVP